jgi:16S rRNA (uracil1498-N3)-methyltransferase
MRHRKKRVPRLFLAGDLEGSAIALADREAHYMSSVLRLRNGDRVLVFNGEGAESLARIERLGRRGGKLSLVDPVPPLPESALDLVLLQAVVKGEAMDAIVQKATELGAKKIIPVKTDYSVVKLDEERAHRRRAHWQKIARSACEQSGRHVPAEVARPMSLPEALAAVAGAELKLLFDTDADEGMPLKVAKPLSVAVLVGPEGGLSPADLDVATAAGFAGVRLGFRVLRADTAATAICSLVQHRWGDLS